MCESVRALVEGRHLGPLWMGNENRLCKFTFNSWQLSATAHKDMSVINVPPIFKCCREVALEICRK